MPFPKGKLADLVYFAKLGVLGLVVGLVAVAFQFALAGAESLRERSSSALHAFPAWGWAVMPVVCGLGGGLSAWLVARFEPDAAGSGIPHVKALLLRLRTLRPWRLIAVKFFGGVVSVGSGLSLGREGPTVQMGAALSDALGRKMGLSRDAARLLACGAGAGVAGAFNAPLAGFIFVIEELRREMSPRTYAGALTAALTADIVSRRLVSELPSFRVENLNPLPWSVLPVVLFIALTGGLCGAAFNRALLTGLEAAARFRLAPRWALAAFAGAAIGLGMWWLPEVAGGGHATAERVLIGNLASAPVVFLAGLLVAKFLATVLSYASAAPGGIFAPMLLMGALLGTVVAKIGAIWFPSLTDAQTALAVLGMVAWFTGAVQAPLTAIVLILEMTGEHHMLFWLALSGLVAQLTAELVGGRPLYDALLELDLRRRGIAPAGSDPIRVVMGVQHGSRLDGRRVGEADLPVGAILVAIERAGRERLPAPDFVIEPGDHITVLVAGESPEIALRVSDEARGM